MTETNQPTSPANQPISARPPVQSEGVVDWLRANLFDGIGNSILTVVTLALLYVALSGLFNWITDAFWLPIWQNRKLFAVGPYPPEQLMQPFAVLWVICALFGLSAGRWGSIIRDLGIGLGALLGLLALLPLGMTTQVATGIALLLLVASYLIALRLNIVGRHLIIAWLLTIPLSLVLLAGSIELFGGTIRFAPTVPTNLWGGLMLTLLLTVVGITFSFPLGILLALGRRSPLPVVRWFCIGYIELIRGAPLITLLFMGLVLLPLFLPAGMGTPSSLVRVSVAITLFSAAYLAENVRGGLQAIPKGQYEAADAVGLNVFDKYRLIILPQALTKVIPAIVGQFISLFKDTSLVALVGLIDLLGIGQSVTQQPEWLGVPGGITKEVYLFIGVIYFIFSYGMSFASRRLERTLNIEQR